MPPPLPTPTADTGGEPDPLLRGPVIVVPRELDPVEWAAYRVTILSANIEGDQLQLEIQYGGGCREHDFWLVASALFMESNPPQVSVLLSHEAYADMCRALQTETVHFDLTALRRKSVEGFPEDSSGSLILRLQGFGEGLRYDF